MKNRDWLETSDHWATPKWLYDKLDAEFHFDFDPCPLHADFDWLEIEWGGANFVNPPYNRKDKPRFIQKAYEEWKKWKTCVLLIPSATGTKQFHDLILPNAEVRFLKWRVAFEGYNTKGEFTTTNKWKHDSMIVILKPTPSKMEKYIPLAQVEQFIKETLTIHQEQYWHSHSFDEYWKGWSQWYKVAVENLEKKLSSLPTEESGWIAVDNQEFEPKEMIKHLIWYHDWIWIAAMDSWVWYDDFLNTPFWITHYMPLPKPPLQ